MFREKIEYIVKVPIEHRKEIKLSDPIIRSAPNKLHKDGRIYVCNKPGNYIAITVSPLHEEFPSQIESGIWPLVKILIDKGYLTVSSCEGHKGSDYFVKIVFGSLESAEDFINLLPKIKGLSYLFEEKSANVVRYMENGLEKYRKVLPDENFSKYEEVKDINKLFYRQYEDCYYVTLKIYPKLKSLNVFKLYYYHKEKIKNFNKSKNELIDYIENNLPYYNL